MRLIIGCVYKREAMSTSRSTAGFTLLEVALVLIIGGIVLSMLGNSLVNTMNTTKITSTKSKIEQIQTALDNYLLVNGQLPCVASLSEPVNTENYAREISSLQGRTCALATAADGTTKSGNVLIGMLPTRALNLPDDYGYDAWGSRFLYAVSVSKTSAATYGHPGEISLVDSAGNSLITPAGTGSHLVLSVGRDRKGGYNSNGSVAVACDTTGIDSENCNNDAIFRSTLISSDVRDHHFDDYVSYKAPAEAIAPNTGAPVNVQVFTTSGTYRRSPNVTVAIVHAQGSGGMAGEKGHEWGGAGGKGEYRIAVVRPDETEAITIMNSRNYPSSCRNFRDINTAPACLGHSSFGNKVRANAGLMGYPSTSESAGQGVSGADGSGGTGGAAVPGTTVYPQYGFAQCTNSAACTAVGDGMVVVYEYQ